MSGSGQFLSHKCWGFAQFFWNQHQKRLSNTNSENNDNSLLMCFQSSPWQKPMGDIFGVCLLYFSLVPPGNMYTCSHKFICACKFQSVLLNSRKTTHGFVFLGGVKKQQQQINVFGCLVDLSLWNYSQRFGSLKNRKKQMYVYKHICSMFLFSGTWRNCVFLMFFLKLL